MGESIMRLRSDWDKLLEYVDHLEESHEALEKRVAAIEQLFRLRGTLTIGGNMAGAGLSIDATNGTVTLGYTDDHGDVQPTPPADAAPAFSSSDDTIVTVASSADNPLVGQLTPVAVGDFVITCTGLGTDTLTGQPIADVTASDSIIPGPAADGTLVIAGG